MLFISSLKIGTAEVAPRPDAEATPLPLADGWSPVRTFALGLALLLAGVLTVQTATYVIRFLDPMGRSFDWGDRERAEEMIDVAMPAIAARTEPTVVAIGSSRVLFNFYPSEFDDELAKLGKHATSYNLSFNGMGPTSLRLLTRRLAKAIDRTGNKPALTLVELTPWLATKVTAQGAFAENYDNVLADGVTTLEELRRRPTNTRILVDRYFRVFTTEEWMSWLTGKIFPGSSSPCMRWFTAWNTVQPDPDFVQIYNQLCPQLDALNPPGSPMWSNKDRGPMKMIFYPEMKDIGERFQRYKERPSVLNRTAQLLEMHCGASELDFDPAELDEYIDALNELKRVSQRVEIFIPPPYPDLIHHTPDGQKRLRDFFARIGRETGVTITDLTVAPGFDGHDFLDPIHLNQLTGSQKWSRLLARLYQRDL